MTDFITRLAYAWLMGEQLTQPRNRPPTVYRFVVSSMRRSDYSEDEIERCLMRHAPHGATIRDMYLIFIA